MQTIEKICLLVFEKRPSRGVMLLLMHFAIMIFSLFSFCYNIHIRQRCYPLSSNRKEQDKKDADRIKTAKIYDCKHKKSIVQREAE